ncbi:unnamed protein product (macronuclear) [Paramecium tetraurelia]|uniref:Uncharacterized protein n=1 Tax=Paramecium tetraurelia TaxID=5888 RepID=A0DZK3_PARTE|nr:uncharacterized protein GSPATT00021638001 [Paramecium tetraurelia]CAK88470.1 unnamed protein product [Paramecium tetraurelia]|eukprot:XP_001455867.1 hypothetical protein (macronuclear) [Paramecium tetraurelia strain d4-2]
MLYDSTQPYQGIKGGTSFTYDDYVPKKRNLSTLSTTTKKQQQKTQTSVATSSNVEDRLLDYEKRRLIKIQRMQMEFLSNKENHQLHKKLQQKSGSNKILQPNELRSTQQNSILGQCMNNFLKKNQKAQLYF